MQPIQTGLFFSPADRFTHFLRLLEGRASWGQSLTEPRPAPVSAFLLQSTREPSSSKQPPQEEGQIALLLVVDSDGLVAGNDMVVAASGDQSALVESATSVPVPNWQLALQASRGTVRSFYLSPDQSHLEFLPEPERTKSQKPRARVKKVKQNQPPATAYSFRIYQRRQVQALWELVPLTPWLNEPEYWRDRIYLWLTNVALFPNLVRDHLELGHEQLQWAEMAPTDNAQSHQTTEWTPAQNEQPPNLWLRIDKPSYFLLQRYLEDYQQDLTVFWEPIPGIMFPWGWHVPIPATPVGTSSAGQFTLYSPDAAPQHIQLQDWQDVYAAIRLEVPWPSAGVRLQQAPTLPRFPVTIRVEQTTQPRAAQFWILDYEQRSTLEQILSLVDPQDLENIYFTALGAPSSEPSTDRESATKLAGDEAALENFKISEASSKPQFLFLADQRNSKNQALHEFPGIPLASYKGFSQLLLPIHWELQPTLRRDQYRELFTLQAGIWTILLPALQDWQELFQAVLDVSPNVRFPFQLFRFSERILRPLPQLVDYLLADQMIHLQEVAARAVFNLERYAHLATRPEIFQPIRQKPNLPPAAATTPARSSTSPENATGLTDTTAPANFSELPKTEFKSATADPTVEFQLQQELLLNGPNQAIWFNLLQVKQAQQNWQGVWDCGIELLWMVPYRTTATALTEQKNQCWLALAEAALHLARQEERLMLQQQSSSQANLTPSNLTPSNSTSINPTPSTTVAVERTRSMRSRRPEVATPAIEPSPQPVLQESPLASQTQHILQTWLHRPPQWQPRMTQLWLLLQDFIKDEHQREQWGQLASTALRTVEGMLRLKERWLLWGRILRWNQDRVELARLREQLLTQITTLGIDWNQLPAFLMQHLLRHASADVADTNHPQAIEIVEPYQNIQQLENRWQDWQNPSLRVVAWAICARLYQRFVATGQAGEKLSETHAQTLDLAAAAAQRCRRQLAEQVQTLTPFSRGLVAVLLSQPPLPETDDNSANHENAFLTDEDYWLNRCAGEERQWLNQYRRSLQERAHSPSPAELLSNQRQRAYFPEGGEQDRDDETVLQLSHQYQRGQISASQLLQQVFQYANTYLDKLRTQPQRDNFTRIIRLARFTRLLAQQVLVKVRHDPTASDPSMAFRQFLAQMDDFWQHQNDNPFYTILLQCVVMQVFIDFGRQDDALERLQLILQQLPHCFNYLDLIDACSQLFVVLESMPIRMRGKPLDAINRIICQFFHSLNELSPLTFQHLYKLLDQMGEAACSRDRLVFDLFQKYQEAEEFAIRQRILQEDFFT